MKVSGWQNVRTLILDGWQLGSSSELAGADWWLQKGGLGAGGETRQVHAATGWKMWKEKRIKEANTETTPWYRTDYELTEPNK